MGSSTSREETPEKKANREEANRIKQEAKEEKQRNKDEAKMWAATADFRKDLDRDFEEVLNARAKEGKPIGIYEEQLDESGKGTVLRRVR